MIYIFLGVPGAGKGTISDMLIKNKGVKHISTGDVFRYNIKNETDLGKKVKELIAAGNLVPDEITNEILLDSIKKFNTTEQIILDGYPRTVGQAQFLESILGTINQELVKVIYLDATKDEVVKRISGRYSCPKCKAGYNIFNSGLNSKEEGICDNDGEALIRRPDDEPEMVENRFVEYVNKTGPLVDFYKEKGVFVSVDAERDLESIYKDTAKLF